MRGPLFTLAIIPKLASTENEPNSRSLWFTLDYTLPLQSNEMLASYSTKKCTIWYGVHGFEF
jgi:hypothetical protein